MTGTKRSGNKNTMQFGTKSLVLSGIALATISIPSAFATGKQLPIERIGLDNARQLVIQFANEPGAFPPVPNVLDMPGPNHRLVVEFADATIDRAKIPTAEQMTAAMHKVLPQVKSIRYSLVPGTDKPRTRIVLDLPEDLQVSPRVVKMEEDSVTINLGQAVKDLVIEEAAPVKRRPNASASAAAPVAVAQAGDTISGATDGAPTADEAPVMQASAPVAVAQSPAQPSYQITAPAATPVQTPVSQSSGDTTVNAGGETVALKPEQKIEQPKAATVSTKGGAKESGWDWNSPMDNELASKIAETKSMGDGGPMPVSSNKLDTDEAALINKVAKEEGDVAPKATPAPVAQLREVPAATTVASLSDVAEATPAVAHAPVPVAEAPAAMAAAPAPVAEAAAPVAEAPAPAAEVPLVQPEPSLAQTKPAAAPPEPEAAPTPAVSEESRSVAKAAQTPQAEVKTEQVDTTQTEVLSATTGSEAATASAVKTPVASESGAAAALKLYNTAVKNHLTGKLAEAISDYKGALAANPEMAEAHSNLGMIYNQQHNYDGALSEFRKALAINPRDAITYNGIGAALRAENDLPGAIKNWQTAVDIDPKLATAHYNLGTAYEKQKDYDKALGAYGDAVRNDVRLGEAFYRMGWILQQKHQFQDAEANYKQALKINPKADYVEDAQKRIADLAQKK